MVTSDHRTRGATERSGVVADLGLRLHRHADELERRAHATPHFGVLMGIVYAYLALFALVAVLTVVWS